MSLSEDVQKVIEHMRAAMAEGERDRAEAHACGDYLKAGVINAVHSLDEYWIDQLQEILDKGSETCENCDNGHITYWAKSGELKTSGCAYWGRNTRPDGYCHNHKPKEVKP